MLPTLQGGDFVIATRFFWRVKTGDLLVIDHASYGRIIKRVTHVSPLQGISVAGDNPASVSSEQIGQIDKQQVRGKVRFSITQAKT